MNLNQTNIKSETFKTMETNEVMEVQQVNPMDLLQREKASYDIQIATAKQFPRNVRRAVDNAVATVTISKKAAESCGYALPRGGKSITGPSVHMARILAQNWGNLRVESRITDITHNQVVSQSVAFDLETNVAVKVEVRRSIMDRNGNRFKDDMITVTGNAANAISFRNAVFNVVPKSIVDAVYDASRNAITGDLSDDEKLTKARVQWVNYFKNNYNATEQEICKAVGVNALTAIKQDHIVLMAGLKQSLVDGDTTADETFHRNDKEVKAQKIADDVKDKLKNKVEPKQTDQKDGELFTGDENKSE